MNSINPDHDRPLVEFFESEGGKAALNALMEFAGWEAMPTPVDVATANFQNGMKAVIARIFLARERLQNPSVYNNPNPLGFS